MPSKFSLKIHYNSHHNSYHNSCHNSHHPSSIINNPSSIIHHQSSIISHLIDCLPRAKLDQPVIPNLKLSTQHHQHYHQHHHYRHHTSCIIHQRDKHSSRGLPFGDGLMPMQTCTQASWSVPLTIAANSIQTILKKKKTFYIVIIHHTMFHQNIHVYQYRWKSISKGFRIQLTIYNVNCSAKEYFS